MDLPKEYLETYVKMCDCKEIQEEHEYADGDWYLDGEGGLHVIGDVNSEEGYILGGDPIDQFVPNIWLPRQDQLQELTGWNDSIRPPAWIGMFRTFTEMTTNNGFPFKLSPCFDYPYDGMEQFMMAFYMYEIHGKFWEKQFNKWVDKKWVEENVAVYNGEEWKKVS